MNFFLSLCEKHCFIDGYCCTCSSVVDLVLMSWWHLVCRLCSTLLTLFHFNHLETDQDFRRNNHSFIYTYKCLIGIKDKNLTLYKAKLSCSFDHLNNSYLHGGNTIMSLCSSSYQQTCQSVRERRQRPITWIKLNSKLITVLKYCPPLDLIGWCVYSRRWNNPDVVAASVLISTL